jgi:hypothetical protein
VAIWLMAIALVRPLSVDESQYVAAAALAAKGLLPYRDFAYLQTPLQPFIFAPLQWLFAGHLLLAMRIANALLGSATIILVYATARRASAGQRAALAAAAMLASCQSFSWSVGVARNDMLPAALMMAALWIVARPANGRSMLAAGVAFGLAASAKISYAVPAAAVFLAPMWGGDPLERRRAAAFAAGVALGLLPALLVVALAPSAFLTEAIVFPATAPAQYYAEIGKAWRLGPFRFVQLIETAAIGPALIAAIEVARRGTGWFADPVRRVVLAAAVGGLISAALNKPFQIFYLLPALPPLFVLAALLLDEIPRWRLALWGIFVAAGLVPVLGWFAHAIGTGTPPVVDAQRRAETLDRALRAAHVDGPVATLASQYVRSIDPRFAAGPFLYRARGLISNDEARAWHVIGREQGQLLAENPPPAIVTGDYPDAQPQQEAELARQARALGYSATGTASGFTVWTRRP